MAAVRFLKQEAGRMAGTAGSSVIAATKVYKRIYIETQSVVSEVKLAQ